VSDHRSVRAEFVEYKMLIATSGLSSGTSGDSATAGNLTYTSCFQYSLTSYVRTSSTQVVSSPCRGISWS
jgi:hypothetical protein